ncbi:IDEAL domain-containing protein [Streptohalobacillus salinus]|uniref:IDEAL domain-containing protein n=1 Tax=Streptohalobacillus salinus TaxID=621096 RepID=A0A2V3WK58_9BACI|nr:IDEAL domain-containing protein [Streptohalobacillus salinus]PXW93058.1 IDEAL domain-containing protein [Streptohalobacillus salinus]
MKKQKVCYYIRRYHRGFNKYMIAKRDFSFENSLYAQLVLDELVSTWNKARFDAAIDAAIDQNDQETFEQLSKTYNHYTIEY